MPNPLILFFLIGFALIGLTVGLIVYLYKISQEYPTPSELLAEIKDPDRITRVKFEPLAEFNKEPTYESQVYEWHFQMKKLGEQLVENNIHHVVFAHGTFAGDDPFDLTHLIGDFFPDNETIATTFKQVLKRTKDNLFKDLGNFDDKYIELVEKGLEKVKVHNYTWSSANHHLARVMGAIDLLIYLDEEKLLNKPMLLIGHSHAGQMFALISEFMASKKFLQEILEVCHYDQSSLPYLWSICKKLKRNKLYINTWGTPIRYTWSKHKNMKVLHMINHRGSSFEAGKANGIFTTRDGDYVQQIGIDGSDTLATTSEHKEINRKLDKLLGIGNDNKYWLEKVKLRKRVPDTGQVVLIDYLDNSRFPNAHQTLFGHGTYTKYEKILFNLTTAIKNLLH